MSKFSLIRYDPAYKPLIAEIMRKLWSQDSAINKQYFEWKHEKNPFIESPIAYLALKGEELIGFRAYFGIDFRDPISDERLPALVSADSFISEPYRVSGLYTALNRYSIKDLQNTGKYKYFLYLSSSKRAEPIFLSSGAKIVAAIETAHWYKRGYQVRMLSRRLLRKVTRWSTTAEDAEPFSALEENASQSTTIELTNKPDIPAMIVLLEQNHNERKPISHRRSKTYLEWRFNNPLSQYRFLFSKENGNYTGYLALQAFATNPVTIRVVDYSVQHTEVFRTLVNFVTKNSHAENICMWTVTKPQEIKNALVDLGFIFPHGKTRPGYPEDLAFMVRPITIKPRPDSWRYGERELLDINNWDLNWIYSDGI